MVRNGMMAAATLALFATISLAQQASPAQSAAAAKAAPVAAHPAARMQAEEERSAPNSPVSQGIKVHGHWVLQVKNADGTLAQRREFENSLVATSPNASQSLTGDEILGLLLTGNAVAGAPAVVLVSAPTGSTSFNSSKFYDCYDATQATCDYLYTESKNFYNPNNVRGPFYFPLGSQNQPAYNTAEAGLSALISFYPSTSWVLSGNYTVQAGSSHSISIVQSAVPVCYSGSDISSFLQSGQYSHGFNPPYIFSGRSVAFGSNQCDTSYATQNLTQDVIMSYGNLTNTAIPGGPLNVTTGQVITITVTISFS
jgi:hypothetical protein